MILRKFQILILLAVLAHSASAQFLDLNIFKPKLDVQSTWLYGTSDNSVGYLNTQVGALFPLSTKLDLGIDPKEILLSKGSLKDKLKGALNNLEPSGHQIFGDFAINNRWYDPGLLSPDHYQQAKIGFSGISAKLKNKRLRTVIFGANVRVSDAIQNPGNPGVNPSAFIGSGGLFDLKGYFVYGLFMTYYGGRFIPAPVLMINRRITPTLHTTITFPVQAKLTKIITAKWRQEAVVTYSAYNHKTESALNYTMQMTAWRLSTQSRIKVGPKSFFYLDAGWQGGSRIGYFRPGDSNITGIDGGNGLFASIKLNVALGKSLLDSKLFDFGF